RTALDHDGDRAGPLPNLSPAHLIPVDLMQPRTVCWNRTDGAPLLLHKTKELSMIGKLIGAAVGAKAADRVRGVSGPGGALLGVGAAAVARRLGPLGLLAAVAGGYAFKRYNDKQAAKPRPAKAGPGKA